MESDTNTSRMKRNLRGEAVGVFFLCMLIMLAVYSIMLAERFSTDGFSDYYMEQSLQNAHWKLENGRLGGAAALALLYNLGINTVSAQLPFTLTLIAVLAWCCADLWALVVACLQSQLDLRVKGLALLAILPGFINISIGEFFFFSNCAVHWIGLLLAGQLALRCMFAGNGVRNRLGAFLLLYLSLSFYQAGIGYFLIWGFLLAALQGKLHADKRTLLSLLWVLVIGFSTSVLSACTPNLLTAVGIISGSERASLSLNLLANLRYLVSTGQKNVLIDGMHFMGPVMAIVTVGLTLWTLMCCLTKKDKNVSIWLVLVLTLLAYIVAFAPHLLSRTMWLAPRTLYSLFSYLCFCALIILWFSRKAGGVLKRCTILHLFLYSLFSYW